MGQLILPSSSAIYVDTSVVIYTIEGNPDYYSLLEPLWSKFYAGEIQIISSDLTLMEVLVVPLRNGNNVLVADYEELLLSSQVQLIPINQSILRQAANLRATTSLKTPDAIHAATALSASCDQFITNDKGFRNAPGLLVVILSEILAS
ncbi:MAG: type II toxin-antitoxin system VapC family toxin [Mastigocoleus sp. MO_167.B18]|uniref:type II toxin-antitoxin system VapC family toxin n=1 Tax=Mastigocoleus sp. MO_188.B34 TaxID=3036635 RepID=UPI0026063433|nr:type II toxin-antitoxin system VapC family toxin [Mastigocoleus sp. MO_188.B34]MDJ0693127.1 type II toxin-antitoxin system VapC family toxin [Mastigocoleus sp. MO_188.B34]MDJ0773034.1 type II toxin-antitoxin system VapC family toxin [Mastigocoleus sp. MO_167.B18]